MQHFVCGKGVVEWKTIHYLQGHLKAFEITDFLFQNGISHLGVYVCVSVSGGGLYLINEKLYGETVP